MGLGEEEPAAGLLGQHALGVGAAGAGGGQGSQGHARGEGEHGEEAGEPAGSVPKHGESLVSFCPQPRCAESIDAQCRDEDDNENRQHEDGGDQPHRDLSSAGRSTHPTEEQGE